MFKNIIQYASNSLEKLSETILGSLCVPPAPGRRPSMTSGVPRTVFLLFVATLYWQAMANYKADCAVRSVIMLSERKRKPSEDKCVYLIYFKAKI